TPCPYTTLFRSHKDDLLGLHNGLNAHGNRPCRYLIYRFEEAGVIPDGTLRQIHHVGGAAKLGARFVKADVAVGADTQNLQINPASLPDQLIRSEERRV